MDQTTVSSGYFDNTYGTSMSSGVADWHEYEKHDLIGANWSNLTVDVTGSQSPIWPIFCFSEIHVVSDNKNLSKAATKRRQHTPQ